MDDRPPLERPIWVKLGLWGLPTRASAVAFIWISIAAAIAAIVYGFWDARFFWGAGFFLSAYMYWLSIQRVDKHDRWD